MSFADIAEECVRIRYPQKAWIGRLVILRLNRDLGNFLST